MDRTRSFSWWGPVLGAVLVGCSGPGDDGTDSTDSEVVTDSEVDTEVTVPGACEPFDLVTDDGVLWLIFATVSPNFDVVGFPNVTAFSGASEDCPAPTSEFTYEGGCTTPDGISFEGNLTVTFGNDGEGSPIASESMVLEGWSRTTGASQLVYDGVSHKAETSAREFRPLLRTWASFEGQVSGTRYAAFPEGLDYARFEKQVVQHDDGDDHFHVVDVDLGCRGHLAGTFEVYSVLSGEPDMFTTPTIATWAYDGRTVEIRIGERDAAGCWEYVVDGRYRGSTCPDDLIRLLTAGT
jgi:hypothetical protein